MKFSLKLNKLNILKEFSNNNNFYIVKNLLFSHLLDHSYYERIEIIRRTE